MKKKSDDKPRYDPIQRLNEVDPLIKIPGEIELEIRRMLQREEVEKNELLLKIKTSCDRIWFIEKGLFRSFRKVKGREENIWFMKENDLMTDPQSFHTKEQSNHVIEALEDGVVHFITRDQMHSLCAKYHIFEHICHLLTWEYYIKFVDYYEDLTSGSIKYRYNLFLKYFPGLEHRIAVKHIASLLKCSDRSLYRVRNSKH